MKDQDFLTGKEIAMILNISKAFAYRLIAKGDIASIRFGRTVRVNKIDLDEFIKKNSSTSQSSESRLKPNNLYTTKTTKNIH